ncbi:MAG TPA: hypothetical protein VEI07_13820 [Planctomycetaceae bacterium]|nr:hypothetical protein [Planctomycetaceae bacterium]
MAVPTSVEPSLAKSILAQIDLLVREAEESQRPLELDPLRSRLFELFVMADAADLIKEPKPGEPRENDLTADALCRSLAQQWNLGEATRESFASKTRLPPEQLSRMRLLWSVMRMWMEWTYAWQRWAEFHDDQGRAPGPGADDADT